MAVEVSLVLQSNVPDAVVDNVDVPLQLFTTFTVGVDGVAFIVKCNVTTLSHPFTFVNVCVGVEDEVYVLLYHTKLTQAAAVVSPVLGVHAVIFTVTVAGALSKLPSFTLKVKLSEPFAFALGTYVNAPVVAFVIVTTPFEPCDTTA